MVGQSTYISANPYHISPTLTFPVQLYLHIIRPPHKVICITFCCCNIVSAFYIKIKQYELNYYKILRHNYETRPILGLFNDYSHNINPPCIGLLV